MKRQFYCPRHFSSFPPPPSPWKIDRDEQARILFSGQYSSRSWVNYVSINIPYCVTKYSVGIYRARELHELFNRYTSSPPLFSSPSQHREDSRTLKSLRIPRESRDFWHQFLPVVHPFAPPPIFCIYLSISIFVFFT